MSRWPTSLPDYRWPSHFLAPGMAALRWLLAGVFHAACAVGRLVSLLYVRDERVLVIRTDGLGDALLFEPALESLARAMSPRLVHVWAPRLTCELLHLCPSIHRLHVVPRGFKAGNLQYFKSIYWRAKLGYLLGRWEFDKVIYPVESPEPLGNWLFTNARARERWLNYGDTANQFDWQREQTHGQASWIIESRPGNAHELLRNEYLASQWSTDKTLRLPRVYTNEKNQQRAQQIVDAWRNEARQAGAEELVGVMPASSMSIKSYPAARFAEALQRLWTQQRVMPVLLGGPDDRPAVEQLGQELIASGVPHLRLDRALGILDMTALVGRLDGLLGVDTGLAHLAVAQGIHTVVLATGGTPNRFFPWPRAVHHRVLTVSMACHNCHDRCTEEEAFCITQIPPDDIVTAYVHLKGRKISLQIYVPRPGELQAAG